MEVPWNFHGTFVQPLCKSNAPFMEVMLHKSCTNVPWKFHGSSMEVVGSCSLFFVEVKCNLARVCKICEGGKFEIACNRQQIKCVTDTSYFLLPRNPPALNLHSTCTQHARPRAYSPVLVALRPRSACTPPARHRTPPPTTVQQTCTRVASPLAHAP